MNYPENYKYTKSHQWMLLEGETATVGITDYAQNSLGDIKFIEFPTVGQAVQPETAFGSIESVKSVSELFSPITGEVTAINEELNKHPEQVNADANNTWIIKVSAKGAQTGDLLSAADYEKFVAEETGA
jgi:glycine cleavage system H protein